jgi:ABC-type multidrug transport system fused ATPase/permease subunit
LEFNFQFKAFFMLDEMKLETPVTVMKEKEADLQASVKDKSKRGIFLTNAVAKWSEESHDPTLDNITVNLNPGKLVAIIGPVGSGKVNLLTNFKDNNNQARRS